MSPESYLVSVGEDGVTVLASGTEDELIELLNNTLDILIAEEGRNERSNPEDVSPRTR